MKSPTAPHRYRNNETAISLGNRFWNKSREQGVSGIIAEYDNGILTTRNGHQFQNFCCCSYLDFDRHPHLIEGAIKALRTYGVLDHCIPRTRVQLPALLHLEEQLSKLFKAQTISAISASVASQGFLPLMASGHLSQGKRPLMVFDKQCHVSMAQIKPVCADESEVVTLPHHDLGRLEDYLKTYENVCYILDGSDSLGGYAPVHDLSYLQEKYGLYLFYDDSHSLSIQGRYGEGYIKTHLETLNARTFIVATLNKAFGSSGACLMMDNQPQSHLEIIERFGGALSYSQPMNTAAIGASLASIELHQSPLLKTRQKMLQENIALFDRSLDSPHKGTDYPIRLIPQKDGESAVSLGRKLFDAGFYTSPVFFPIVAKGQAAIRLMIHALHDPEDIKTIAHLIHHHMQEQKEMEGEEHATL